MPGVRMLAVVRVARDDLDGLFVGGRHHRDLGADGRKTAAFLTQMDPDPVVGAGPVVLQDVQQMRMGVEGCFRNQQIRLSIPIDVITDDVEAVTLQGRIEQE